MPTSHPPLRRPARPSRLSIAGLIVPAVSAVARKIKHPYINPLRTPLYVLLAGSLLAVGAKAQSNLLVAGGFEGITSLPGYPATTTGVWATESATISGAGNGITPFGSQMLLIGHAGGGTAAQTNQVVYGPFKAGSVATFSVKFNTWLAASGSTPQSVAVSLMTDDGVALTGTRYTSPTVALDTDTSTWQTATVQVILPSDTNYLSAEIIMWQYSGALPYGTALAYADDAVLTVVPPSESVPVLSVPANISVNATSAAGAPVTFSASATSTQSLELFRRDTQTGEPWHAYSTTFTSGVTGTFTLGFNVVSQTNGDNSIFIDDVKVTSGSSTLFADGFETPALPSSYMWSPNNGAPSTDGGNWLFNDYGGILRGPSAPNWGTIANGTPPEGSQIGIIRNVASTSGSMKSVNAISLVAGQTYTLSFDQASREIFGGALTYTVTLEQQISVPVTATPASGSTFPIGTTAVSLSATSTGGTSTGSFNVTVNQLPVAITLSNLAQSYDGTGKAPTVTTNPTGVPVNLSYVAPAGGSLPPIGAGSYTVIATPSDTKYTGTTTDTLVIAKAASTTTTVGAGPFTYDGTTHGGGSGTVTGANLSTSATSVTYSANADGTGVADRVDAGTYYVTAHFAGDANHAASDGAPVAITINKAASTTTTVGAGPFTYDGTSHAGGSGNVSGAGTITGTATLTYSGDQVDAGSYTVTAHYAGDANHTASDGAPVTIVINRAPSITTTLGGGPFTYDGTVHAAGSGAVTGILLSTSATSVSYSANADGSGVADQTDAGTYYVTAHYAGDANHLPSDGTAVAITINKASSSTTTIGADPFTYDGTTHAGGSGTVTGANLSTSATSVTYSANSDGSGVADRIDAGTYYVTAHYAGDANHLASDGAAVAITINKAATATTLAAVPAVQAVGQPVTLTATVTSQAAVTSGTVTFTMGSTTLGTATVDGSGVAVFTTTALPLGPQSITATYGGSSNFIGSASSAVPVLIYGYPAGGGTFVIGDGNATTGATVNFWGSQWERNNRVSGGTSNASFKGFAVGPTPPVVGGTFTAAPGNSRPSPASVPAYLGVIVTSKVTKSRSAITGTIVKLVVVKVNPGYAEDPGHAGTAEDRGDDDGARRSGYADDPGHAGTGTVVGVIP